MCKWSRPPYPQPTITELPQALTAMSDATTPPGKLTKLDAALHLLRRAARAFLDENDAITALVLAGSAEDILQGLLKRAGRADEAARASLAELAPKIAHALVPQHAAAVTSRGAIKAMRDPFNWLRHADDEDDPPEIAADLRFHTACALLRAAQNHYALENEVPLSDGDVIKLLFIVGVSA
jgi:hypothetical protein